MLPEVTEKPSMQSNLPAGFTFCNPKVGLAHGSLQSPVHFTDLLHYTEVDDSFQSMYLLGATNLFNVNSPLQLHFISVKHHLKEGWYFADGALLSADGTRATQFLLDKPIYDRGTQPIEEMNRTVQRIVSKMLRKCGLPNIRLLLHLTKYTWLVKRWTVPLYLGLTECAHHMMCKEHACSFNSACATFAEIIIANSYRGAKKFIKQEPEQWELSQDLIMN